MRINYKLQYRQGMFQIFIGLFTFNIYFPMIRWDKKEYALYLKTCIGYRPNKTTYWKYAGFICFLGFGFGFAYNHIDNPNYDYILAKSYDEDFIKEEQ